MELYYLLVQRSIWIIQLVIVFLISSEGRHYHRRMFDRRPIRIGRQPHILADDHHITVHRNERISLKCRVRDRGTKSVQWNLINSSHPLTIGDVVWTSDKDFDILHTTYNNSFESWDLIIDNVQPNHSNTYVCQIASTITLRRRVHLTVLPTMRKINPGVSLHGKDVLDSRETINLTCNATGAERAPVGVDWFHNGVMIRQDDIRWRGRLRTINRKSKVSSRSLISQLIIEKSTLQDRGSYICRSSDRKAKSIDVSILEDDNPPSRPARNSTYFVYLTSKPDNVPFYASTEELSANPNAAALSTINVVVLAIGFVLSTR